MKPRTRACAGHVVLWLVPGKQSISIYDYARRSHVIISAGISGSSVHVFNHGRSAHFVGAGSGGRRSLYDYGYRHPVSLQIHGSLYKGYDYGTRGHFSG